MKVNASGTPQTSRTSLRDLDLGVLLAFEAMMEERLVTRAAKRLGITQSALSGILARLRIRLSDDLFIRGRDGMQPTAIASELLVPVRKALDALEGAMGCGSTFSPQQGGTFTIGLSDYASCLLLPDLLRRLRSEFPNITAHVESVTASAPTRLLDRGQLDLMVGPLAPADPRFVNRHLLTETFLTIMKANHATAAAEMDLDLFTRLPHMHIAPDGLATEWWGYVDAKLEEIGRARTVRITLSTFLLGFWALGETDLIWTLPSRLARIASTRFGFALRSPPLPPRPFSISMIWHRRNDRIASNI